MKNRIIGGIIAGAIVGAVGVTGITKTVYKSVSISESAKEKVVATAKILSMSQRDTASKMILEWKPVVSPSPISSSTLITWDSSKINSDKVKITIIKRISTDPDTYELVKVLEDDTENDGRFGWTFKDSDYEGDTYLDIGCGSTPPEGCQSLPIIKLI